MGFAENLREELDFQDIQVKELAERTGICKGTLDKYLSKRQVQPSVENAVRIAKTLGVTVEELVEGKNISNLTKNEAFKSVLRHYKILNEFNRKTVDDLMKSLVARQA